MLLGPGVGCCPMWWARGAQEKVPRGPPSTVSSLPQSGVSLMPAHGVGMSASLETLLSAEAAPFICIRLCPTQSHLCFLPSHPRIVLGAFCNKLFCHIYIFFNDFQFYRSPLGNPKESCVNRGDLTFVSKIHFPSLGASEAVPLSRHWLGG